MVNTSRGMFLFFLLVSELFSEHLCSASLCFLSHCAGCFMARTRLRAFRVIICHSCISCNGNISNSHSAKETAKERDRMRAEEKLERSNSRRSLSLALPICVLARCGTRPDAADFALMLKLGELNQLCAKDIPFTLFSGDKGQCRIAPQLPASPAWLASARSSTSRMSLTLSSPFPVFSSL